MTDTKSIVMSRVRAIHVMRPFVSTASLSVALILVSVYAVSREVWVAMVFRNMPSVSDLGAVARFFGAAFLDTDLAVQLSCVVAFAGVIMLARETARLLATLPRASRVSA